jgi:adenylosuccinate lyase
MTTKEIDDCFDPQYQLRHLDLVYQRLGIWG